MVAASSSTSSSVAPAASQRHTLDFPVELMNEMDKRDEANRKNVRPAALLFDQRQFESFADFLDVHDDGNFHQRKVSIHQFSADAVDEALVPERCVFNRKFNSDNQPEGYKVLVDSLLGELNRTKWQDVGAQDAAELALKGLGKIPSASPHRVKWTFVEYRPLHPITRAAVGHPECIVAIRNQRAGVTAAQRVVISGHQMTTPERVGRRRSDLLAGRVLAKDLVSGGIPPIRDSLK
jgi:hypothetical protein